MLKKDAVFNWTDECQEGFEERKRESASDRVFAQFNVTCTKIVSTDVSVVALGVDVSQIQDGQEIPIAFASEALHLNERAYSVGEGEALSSKGFVNWH